jgi:hypothetical protein
MIILQQNDNKLTLFNEQAREFAEKNPEFADYFKPINSIDDMFTPYNSWMDSFTEEDKVKYKVIPDGKYDFSGVYVCADFNDHYDIEQLTDYKEIDHLYKYGVVDNASQVIENCDIPDNAVVLLTPVFKDKSEPYSGWRWHKWGRYYGIQEHCCEYLNDEDDVEMIYCFSIVTLKHIEFDTEV